MSTYSVRHDFMEAKLDQTMKKMGVDRGKGMEALAYSIIFGGSEHEFRRDCVDGSQEKQIDFVVVEDNPHNNEATIHVVQVKAGNGWPSNAVMQLHIGLKYMFEFEMDRVKTLSNEKLRLKIEQVRSLWKKYRSSNIHLVIHFVTLGDTSDPRHEFRQEVGNIHTTINAKGIKLAIKEWGASELYDQLRLRDEHGRDIQAELPVVCADPTNPGVLVHDAVGIRGIVFTTTGQALAELVKEHRDWIFEKNIRPYLGDANRVNREIYRTCSTDSEAPNFWFLNNGITVLCDKFEQELIPENPYVRIENMQIVNGCQTSSTLARALEERKLHPNTRVLLRVYATRDNSFLDHVTLTTNSQTSIVSRNLRANHVVQRDLQAVFREQYGIAVERKPNEFDGEKILHVTSNETIGRAYLAVRMRLPSIAAFKGESVVFSTHYAPVFERSSHVHLYFSYAVFHAVQHLAAETKKAGTETIEATTVLEFGLHHLSRITAALILGSDLNWPSDRVLGKAKALWDNPYVGEKEFVEATLTMVSLLSSPPQNMDVLTYLQSDDIQTDVDAKVDARLTQQVGPAK